MSDWGGPPEGKKASRTSVYCTGTSLESQLKVEGTATSKSTFTTVIYQWISDRHSFNNSILTHLFRNTTLSFKLQKSHVLAYPSDGSTCPASWPLDPSHKLSACNASISLPQTSFGCFKPGVTRMSGMFRVVGLGVCIGRRRFQDDLCEEQQQKKKTINLNFSPW